MAKRYSVITYNINNYEVVHEVECPDPEAEYIMVTDTPSLCSETWNVVVDKSLDGMSLFDKCYAIRFNCFKYCKTDICVRIDGSVGLKQSLKPLIDIFEQGGYDLCLMPHPHRDNFVDEYDAWINQRGYNKAQAERCLDYMRSKGYNTSYKGLFQCGFIIQRRCEVTDKINQMVFDMLKELGTNGIIERNDQIPFSFIVNKYFSNLKVLPISSQIFSSPYLQLYIHGSNDFNLNHMPDMTKRDVHYMFNKKVECLYLLSPMGDVVTNFDRRNMACREYELLYKIRNLQNATNTEILDTLNRKARKHLRVIRMLIAISILLIVSLLIIIIVFNL
jgi:hypothetical protein